LPSLPARDAVHFVGDERENSIATVMASPERRLAIRADTAGSSWSASRGSSVNLNPAIERRAALRS
jgi:hypothetical protein